MVKFSSILIITYGRSGSTLLQGLLNSIDGVLVRGENHNLCYGFYKSYRSLVETKGMKMDGATPVSPWFGCQEVDVDMFLVGVQNLLRDLLVGPGRRIGEVSCYGFKEIRYIEVADAEIMNYLEFLSDVFPNPALIFLTRDHHEVVTSGWWATQDPGEVRRELERLEARFKEYSEGNMNCFALDYSDMTNRSPRLRQLYEFVGAVYIEETVREVLLKQHSYPTSRGRAKKC